MLNSCEQRRDEFAMNPKRRTGQIETLAQGIARIGPEFERFATLFLDALQYALQSKDKSLADLRSIQDWTVRYGISKAEGVAEVASVGGFVKQSNIIVDPNRLRSLDIQVAKVRDAVRGSNMDVGGRTVELSEFE